MELHDELRRARKVSKLSATVQAEGMGFTPTTIQAMERGERPIRLEVDARRYLRTLLVLDRERKQGLLRRMDLLRRRGTGSGADLRILRKDAKFTYADVARLLGCHPEVIRQRELLSEWSRYDTAAYMAALRKLLDARSDTLRATVTRILSEPNGQLTA